MEENRLILSPRSLPCQSHPHLIEGYARVLIINHELVPSLLIDLLVLSNVSYIQSQVKVTNARTRKTAPRVNVPGSWVKGMRMQSLSIKVCVWRGQEDVHHCFASPGVWRPRTVQTNGWFTNGIRWLERGRSRPQESAMMIFMIK